MPSSSSKAVQQGSTQSASPKFAFPDDIPINKVSTLDQLTGQFGGVKDGLPELVKNSKDQYFRLHINEEAQRQIVVLVSTALRRLAVIDFAGAPLSNFEGWAVWSEPTAGRSDESADIEAGHGNGGKAFMVHGATDFAFMESCFEAYRTRKGFKNSPPVDRYKPGYAVEAGQQTCALPEIDPTWRLEQFMGELGMCSGDLPAEALEVFKQRNAFTGVLLSRVSEWATKRRDAVKRLASEQLPQIIATHGQTALTIETCKVWVVVDGKTVNEGSPIRPISIPPHAGFEEPWVFEIPDILPDPDGHDAIDTVLGCGGERTLTLRTSARHLRIHADTKARNVIRIWNDRNNVATWTLPSLGILPASIGFIYGELRCPALTGEHLAGADRVHLADTPLTRALRQWTTDRVRELADALHEAMLTETRPQERKQARTALSSIRDLMRQFLEPDADGELFGDSRSKGNSTVGDSKDRKGFKFGDRIDEIVLENRAADLIVVQGTTIPLSYRCVDLSRRKPRPARAVGLTLHNSGGLDWRFDGSGNLTPHECGIAEIWLETQDGEVSSNHVELWVAHACDVEAETPAEPLKQGEIASISFVFQTDDGPLEESVLDVSVLEPYAGKIGRKGRFKAGDAEGVATIRVRYGIAEDAHRDFQIKIGSERVPEPEGKGGHGGDVPLILFCGDEAPGKEDLPPNQRTILGGPELPTIIEDPLFPSVVWINDSSKEAIRVRKSKGGSSGVGKITSRNFIHFVALKCFDILKRLWIRQRIAGTSITEYQYIQYAMEAELYCSDFVDAAWELSEQLIRNPETADG